MSSPNAATRLAGPVLLAFLSLACAGPASSARSYTWRPLAEVIPAGATATRVTPVALPAAAVAPMDEARTDSATPADSWMEGPVGVVADDQERDLWPRLESSSRRRRFATIFWARRDLDDDSFVNEARQEFARRLDVAETVFGGDDGPGWRTPFGRALLVFGFPRRVEASLGGAETVEVRDGELAVPREPRGGDWIRWLYGLDLQLEPFTATRDSGARRVVYVHYLYSAGAWRMSCGSTLWFTSLGGRGFVLPGGSRVLGRDYRSGGGPGVWETGRTAPEVPGTGIPVKHPLLVHGGPPGAALPIIAPRCLEMMRFRIQRDLRDDLLYPSTW